jgi:hypothetical protein
MKIIRNILPLFVAILLTNCERKKESQTIEIKEAIGEQISTPTEKLGVGEIAHTFEGELRSGTFTLTYKQHKIDAQELWSKSDISAIRVIGNIALREGNNTFNYPFYLTRFPDKTAGMSLQGFWISYGTPNTLRIDVWHPEPSWEIYSSQNVSKESCHKGLITKHWVVDGDPIK